MSSRRAGTAKGTPRRRRRLAAAAGLLAFVAVLVYVFVFSRHGYLRRRELERENERLTGEVSELRRENEKLKRDLKNLDDPAAVEKLAREELGLVKNGETIYRFIEPETAARDGGQKPPR